MAFSLFTVARDFLVDEAKFRENHPHAWLVWTLGKPTAEPIIAPTLTHGGGKKVPEVGDPIAIPILKGKAGAFALGVTIGRTENNDVVLRHSEVSRFHAYVQESPSGNALVDADSKNGTFIEGVRLVASRPQPLPPSCEVRFGELALRYYSRDAFIEYLRKS